MSFSLHVDNKGIVILILGKGSTQELGEHSLNAEKTYSVNFIDHRKNVVWARVMMMRTVIYLLMVQKLSNLKQKIFCFKFNNFCIIIACPLRLGNISKDWSVDSMKDTGLNGYAHDFSVDYNAIVVDDIKDIYKHLMKKNNIAW